MVASKEQGLAGTDWTRTIVHLRGHYFAFLDWMEARQNDDFSFVCRWRSYQPASLQQGAFKAVSPGGNTMTIQPANTVFQNATRWEIDGAAAPYVLEQYRPAALLKGQPQTILNLMYVSGPKRPDEFQAKRAGYAAMMVKGKMAQGDHAGDPTVDHLALIGVRGGELPCGGIETDAMVYYLSGNQLHLAGVRTIKADLPTIRSSDGTAGRPEVRRQEIFWSHRPANVLLDLATGKAQVDVAGEGRVKMKYGGQWHVYEPQAAPPAASEWLWLGGGAIRRGCAGSARRTAQPRRRDGDALEESARAFTRRSAAGGQRRRRPVRRDEIAAASGAPAVPADAGEG